MNKKSRFLLWIRIVVWGGGAALFALSLSKKIGHWGEPAGVIWLVGGFYLSDRLASRNK
jgi:hypothetical protein